MDKKLLLQMLALIGGAMALPRHLYDYDDRIPNVDYDTQDKIIKARQDRECKSKLPEPSKPYQAPRKLSKKQRKKRRK